MSIIADLKQRKLFQWAVAYLAGAWLLMQLIDVIGGRWGIASEVARLIDLALITGFFITLVIAWYHGDQGRQRVSGPELLIIAGLLAIGGLGLGLLDTDPRTLSEPEPPPGLNRDSDQEPWIAVLPFRVQSDEVQLRDFAAGLTEDISNGLSDFSYLLVLSQSSTSKLNAESADIRQIGQELGARYVLQGSLRRSGATTRITSQLVDAHNGTQIWTETFDRELNDDDLLPLQDELTDRIVATVADPSGVVVRALVAPADQKPAAELTPYEAVLRYFLFQQRISAQDHFITRAALEQAVESDAGYADAWTCLSLIYQQEYMNNLNPQPQSLERALDAAQRAIDLDPASSRAHFAMAQARYFMKDTDLFEMHAERAVELNPRNTDTMAMVGIMMGYSGDWERSVLLTGRAMRLNPHHTGWYYFNTFFDQYRQQNYAEALAIAQKINLPDYWAAHMALAIAHAQLGHESDANRAAEDLLQTWPTFEQDYYQQGLVKWIFGQPELIEQINDGLRKAGIDLVVANQEES